MSSKVILEPSFLAFDQKNYLSQLKEVKALGIKAIHFDVMDGEFVTNIAPFDMRCINDIIMLGFEISVHIMGYDFLKFANYFKKLPIKALTFQYEAIRNEDDENKMFEAFDILKENNICVGIAINPHTDINNAYKFIEISNIITIMSVVAGEGGQKFMLDALNNLKIAKQFQKRNDIIIQIDGGVNLENIDLFINDVDRIVSGTSFMSSKDQMQKFIKKIENF